MMDEFYELFCWLCLDVCKSEWWRLGKGVLYVLMMDERLNYVYISLDVMTESCSFSFSGCCLAD